MPYNPTERTPLLGNAMANLNIEPDNFYPSLSSTLSRLSTLDISDIHEDDLLQHLIIGPGVQEALTTAYALVTLLKLRQLRGIAATFNGMDDPYQHWLHEEKKVADLLLLNQKIIGLWTRFLSQDRLSRDIDALLWNPFSVDSNGSSSLRVFDLLKEPDSPNELVCHPLIMASALHAWRHGTLYPLLSSTSPLLVRIDATCTPRYTHILHLASVLAYLSLLINYCLNPPTRPHIYSWKDIGIREHLIMIFALSSFQRAWSFITISSVFVVLAFASSLPSPPYPGDLGFTFLLVGLILLAAHLHRTQSPSPSFLLKPDYSIPFSVFLYRGFYRLVIPAATFYLPSALITFYLLSNSLDNILPSLAEPASLFSASVMPPAPMETRSLLFFVLLVVILLWAISSLISILAFPSQLFSQFNYSSAWDRYSPIIGQASRRIFFNAVLSNSERYSFPPPFNLAQFFLIKFPLFFARTLGFPLPWLFRAEQYLWRITVGPIMGLLALIFRVSRLLYKTSYF